MLSHWWNPHAWFFCFHVVFSGFLIMKASDSKKLIPKITYIFLAFLIRSFASYEYETEIWINQWLVASWGLLGSGVSYYFSPKFTIIVALVFFLYYLQHLLCIPHGFVTYKLSLQLCSLGYVVPFVLKNVSWLELADFLFYRLLWIHLHSYIYCKFGPMSQIWPM